MVKRHGRECVAHANIKRFAHSSFVTKTAAALGRLAKRGPASSSDHVEFEVIRALEWLQHSGDNGTSRRLTACLVLRT